MNRLQSIQLLGFRDNVHVAHWQAPRKTNEHATLGDLYEAILPKVDELTELAIARDGDTAFPAVNIGIVNGAAYLDLLGSGLALIQEIRDGINAEMGKMSQQPYRFDDELNIIADITADIRRAGYKLEVTLP